MKKGPLWQDTVKIQLEKLSNISVDSSTLSFNDVKKFMPIPIPITNKINPTGCVGGGRLAPGLQFFAFPGKKIIDNL